MNITQVSLNISHHKLSWDDVRERILTDSLGNSDIETSNIFMEDDGTFTINGQTGYSYTSEAEPGILFRFVSCGVEYLKKCPSALKALNINHWISQKQGKVYLVRTRCQGDNRRIRAILTERYAPYDNTAVFDMVFEHFQSYIPVGLVITDDSFHLRLAHPNGVDVSTKNVGDIVHGGCHISNSETGMGSLRFDVIAYRLLCKNGLVSPEPLALQSRVHLGSTDTVAEFFQGAVREARERADWLLEAMKDAHVEQFDRTHGDALVTRLGTRFRWPKLFVSHVQEKLAYEDATKFGLIQAITSAARETANPDDRLKYERHAGMLLSLSIRRLAEIAYAESALEISA